MTTPAILECRVNLLGGLRVQHAGRSITRFRTHKTGALLAYLAHYRNRSHPREVLIDLFWPEGTPERSRNSLSISLSSIRHQLEPPGVEAGAILFADRFTVRLNPEKVTTDVSDFETRLKRATEDCSEAEGFQLLADAVEMYCGPLLPGYYEDWIAPEQERLTEAYVQALRRLYRRLFRQKEFGRALDYARRAITADPNREEIHRDLMGLYVAAGHPSAALEQYNRLERVLAEDLKVRPSAATRQLLHKIETHMQAAETAAPFAGSSAPVLPAVSTLSAPETPISAVALPPAPVAELVLPTGTLTFLVTDIVGSTARWEREGNAYREAQKAHHKLLRSQFAEHGGYEVKDLGDGFLVVFTRAGQALECAVACQRDLTAVQDVQTEGTKDCGVTANIQVRMALHSGEAEPDGRDYHDLTVNRASRLLNAAHGGQILCSESTACLLRRDLEAEVRLMDLGVYRLRGLPIPERLFQVSWPKMPIPTFPPPRAESGYTTHIPLPVTRFFGRGQELARACEMLRDPNTRLLTVTGPGGNGKTRLAIEASRQLVESFNGAVWFVSLGELMDAQTIPNAVAGALQLMPEPGVEPLLQVKEMLARQPSLVVLDNFEQLVDGGSEIVQKLLESVPTLTFLVTSRQQLNISAEQTFALAPLPTPSGNDSPTQLGMYESVQLFVDRAQSVKPDFQVTNTNAPAVAALCDNLEGIPLAIELAAARAQIFTPAQMLAQLQNRFTFLVSRKRDIADRHRTLRAAVEWSYMLLSPELQRLFATLSVFRDGWMAAAAAAVHQINGDLHAYDVQDQADDPLTLDLLAQLQECSLVQMVDRGDVMRFEMLETLREFADSMLTTNLKRSALTNHAAYYLKLAEYAAANFFSVNQAEWFRRLDNEYENLKAALTWSSVAPSPSVGMRLCIALQRFWLIHGHLVEGQQWCDRILSTPGAQSFPIERARTSSCAAVLAVHKGDSVSARSHYRDSLDIMKEEGDQVGTADALSGLGIVGIMRGEYGSAVSCLQESLVIFRTTDDSRGVARALGNLGIVAGFEGDFDLAQTYCNESTEIMKSIGDLRGAASSINNLGSAARNHGNYAAARSCFEECHKLMVEIGDKGGTAAALENLGVSTQDQGDFDTARTYVEQSLEIFREIGDTSGVANALQCLGSICGSQGNYESAWSCMLQSVTIKTEIGDRKGIADSLKALAMIAVSENKIEQALVAWGAAEELRNQIGTPIPNNELEEYSQALADARGAVGEKAFEAAWSKGREMSTEQHIAQELNSMMTRM